jgi:hypothetical protein
MERLESLFLHSNGLRSISQRAFADMTNITYMFASHHTLMI